LLLAEAEVPVPEGLESAAAIAEQIPERHRAWPQPVDLDAYAASGLPTRVMGRELEEDRLFFAAALASGAALAEAAAGVGGD
jgi:hypothetical protein